MRDVFPEFYSPSPDDEKRFVTEGVVVVDTNVLLDMYRLAEAQRNETLAVLEKIGDRLWIPYQVGLEYQRNRLGVIRAQAGYYDSLVGLHGVNDATKLKKALGGLQVPKEVKDEVRPLLDDLAQSLKDAVVDYVEKVKAIRERHVVTVAQGIRDDPVRRRLDVLFAGRVGEPLAKDEHQMRVEEATRRREAEIPPGYKDDKGNEELNAGDYLLWSEILDFAGNEMFGRPFLLVTNDTKDDWYVDKSTKSPRPELIREFYGRNEFGYHQVDLEKLLRLANEHLDVTVTDETIEKASELSRPDLNFGQEFRLLLLQTDKQVRDSLDQPPTEEDRIRRAAARRLLMPQWDRNEFTNKSDEADAIRARIARMTESEWKHLRRILEETNMTKLDPNQEENGE